jgi:phosphoribosylformylglycinamidine cyclo-ligase
MHTTFNMGTGFVVALPEAAAARLVERTQDGRIIGSVDTGEGVSIRGLRLDG